MFALMVLSSSWHPKFISFLDENKSLMNFRLLFLLKSDEEGLQLIWQREDINSYANNNYSELATFARLPSDVSVLLTSQEEEEMGWLSGSVHPTQLQVDWMTKGPGLQIPYKSSQGLDFTTQDYFLRKLFCCGVFNHFVSHSLCAPFLSSTGLSWQHQEWGAMYGLVLKSCIQQPWRIKLGYKTGLPAALSPPCAEACVDGREQDFVTHFVLWPFSGGTQNTLGKLFLFFYFYFLTWSWK